MNFHSHQPNDPGERRFIDSLTRIGDDQMHVWSDLSVEDRQIDIVLLDFNLGRLCVLEVKTFRALEEITLYEVIPSRNRSSLKSPRHQANEGAKRLKHVLSCTSVGDMARNTWIPGIPVLHSLTDKYLNQKCCEDAVWEEEVRFWISLSDLSSLERLRDKILSNFHEEFKSKYKPWSSQQCDQVLDQMNRLFSSREPQSVNPHLVLRSKGDHLPLKIALIPPVIIGKDDIGTGPVDVDLTDYPSAEYISRRHARIDERDGEFWLIDLGSLNGTFLMNSESEEFERVTTTQICPGDVLSIANTQFVFNL